MQKTEMPCVLWIVIGENARTLAQRSRASLESVAPEVYEKRIVHEPVGQRPKIMLNPMRASRCAKTTLFDSLSWTRTEALYVDADTIFTDDPHVFFDIIRAGFDLVIAPSPNQNKDHLWHLQPEDRQLTYESCGHVPVQLQGGVFAFAINERVRRFFNAWYGEWSIYADQDQGALLRALHRVPLRVWLAGGPMTWDGGIIKHLWGEARAR